MTFGVNHLGHFLLTELLLDRLVPERPVAGGRRWPRSAHRFAFGGLAFDDLQSDLGYSSMDVYAKSKLANILFSNELARRLDGTGVTSNSLHPGAIRSGFGKSRRTTAGIDRIAMIVGRAVPAVAQERGQDHRLPGVVARRGRRHRRLLRAAQAAPPVEARSRRRRGPAPVGRRARR